MSSFIKSLFASLKAWVIVFLSIGLTTKILGENSLFGSPLKMNIISFVIAIIVFILSFKIFKFC